MRLWVRLVRKLALGGDVKANALSKALAESIYLAVDTASKHKIDFHINAGNLVMDEATTDEQRDTTISFIIDLLAKDSPHESIKRISKMMRNIYTCCRHISESPYNYAKRFEGLVSQYLNHCHKTSADQDNQVFVMVLLENSALPQSVQDNLILQLTTNSQLRDDPELQRSINMPRKSFDSILELAKKIEENTTGIHSEDMNRYESQLNKILLTIDKTYMRTKNTERVHSRIRLEDEILALSQIECDTTNTAEQRVPDVVPRNPPSFLYKNHY